MYICFFLFIYYTYYYLYTVLFVVRKVFTNFNNFHQERLDKGKKLQCFIFKSVLGYFCSFRNSFCNISSNVREGSVESFSNFIEL